MNARRMLCSVGWILLAASWASGQCTQTDSRFQGPKFKLIGRVINRADNAEVSFVTLKLNGSMQRQMAVTDAQGRFLFDCLEGGTYTVDATKHGFKPVTTHFSITTGGINDGIIYMEPATEITVKAEGHTLSAREAQIPDKARKQFENGMKKLYERNDIEASIDDFQKAIELHPEYDDAYVQLGIAYSRLARSDEAEKTFRKAIEVYDQNGSAHGFLGKLLSERGRVEEAVPELQKAVELDDTNWLAHLDLARVLAKQGKKTDAYTNAKRAHELKPTVQDVHLAYYNACVSLGKYTEALAELDEVVKLYPKSEMAKKLLAIRPKLAAEPAAKTP